MIKTAAHWLTLTGVLLLSLPALATNATKVLLNTNLGPIEVELFADKSPKSVANFLEYAKAGFYDGTIFHRVIPGFVAQGGGFDTQMTQRPTRAPIENESHNGLSNEAGTLAMARTQSPHSATSQFYINLKDNAFLDANPNQPGQFGYTVFGRVTKGQDVLDKMASIATGPAGPFPSDVPKTPIVIQSTQVLE